MSRFRIRAMCGGKTKQIEKISLFSLSFLCNCNKLNLVSCVFLLTARLIWWWLCVSIAHSSLRLSWRTGVLSDPPIFSNFNLSPLPLCLFIHTHVLFGNFPQREREERSVMAQALFQSSFLACSDLSSNSSNGSDVFVIADSFPLL